jgi:hypothetical protein
MLRHWSTVIALSVFPAFGGAVPALAPQPPSVAVCWGDVNADDKVDVADAHQVARFAIAMRVISRSAVLAHGDVTGDGRVNVTDAQQIARHSVGLQSARRLTERCSR